MVLLLDVGNTHTHPGFAQGSRVTSLPAFPTALWNVGNASALLKRIGRSKTVTGAAFSSVVPRVNAVIRRAIANQFGVRSLELNYRNLRIVGIDYPKPGSIGADRLANAAAVRTLFGAPSVVVDFGTAVTFDVVDRAGNYAGGIIAPGLNAMTDYLHEKTALLPRIRIREVQGVVGKSTEQAMLIGAVHGYRGLVSALLKKLKAELKAQELPVVATGGYAKLIAAQLPEITAIEPKLTLQGLRLVWEANQNLHTSG